MPTLAALLTCYNRKDATIRCLTALYHQSIPAKLIVYLVDDGSTDGTKEAVSELFPDTQIIQGDGNLYWAGGMRLAFSAALKTGYDYYLWLNDDTILYDHAIALMFETLASFPPDTEQSRIITGATWDPTKKSTSYGGVIRKKAWRPVHFNLVMPNGKPTRCDTHHGNCVLIPGQVAKKVGNISLGYKHYLGDFDYGLNAHKYGFGVWLTPTHIGECENSKKTRQIRNYESFNKKLKALSSPKGLSTSTTDLPPISDWKIFCQRHAGIFWPLYWLFPYYRIFRC